MIPEKKRPAFRAAARGLLAGLLMGAGPRAVAAVAEESTDVVVIGATPGGIAAAIAAAQGGVNVVLVEEKNHVGGIIAGGLTTADIGDNKAVGGSFNDFRREIREYYAARYGENSDQYEDCRAGRQVEPHVAEAVYRSMLQQQPRVRLLTGYYLDQVEMEGKRLARVVIRSTGAPAESRTLAAKIFIDGTYEGDLAAGAGVKYRVGREGRAEYGESLAGRIYTRMFTRELLPGSTGEADEGIQAFCFRIHVTAVPANRVPFVRPAAYERNDYKFLLADLKAGRISRLTEIFQFQKAPNGKFELNSNHRDPVKGAPCESFDLAEENWGWPEAGRAERQRIFDRYWTYQEGMLWFLQTDPEVPEALRLETATYGLCRDEFTDTNNRPYHLYVRQGRRILGEYIFTQREEDPDPATGLPRLHRDSIAIGTYPWDSHAVHKYDLQFPGNREGYYVVRHPPLQIPFGVLVPKEIDGLLVPVACSASHVGYQTIRMEPVFMALGQASGFAAAQAVTTAIPVRKISVSQLQAELTRRHGVISYFEDVSPTHPAAAAIQFLGPRGLSLNFTANPDRGITQEQAAGILARILAAEGLSWQVPVTKAGLLSGAILAAWLGEARLSAPSAGSAANGSKPELTVGDFAQAVAAALGATR